MTIREDTGFSLEHELLPTYVLFLNIKYTAKSSHHVMIILNLIIDKTFKHSHINNLKM